MKKMIIQTICMAFLFSAASHAAEDGRITIAQYEQRTSALLHKIAQLQMQIAELESASRKTPKQVNDLNMLKLELYSYRLQLNKFISPATEDSGLKSSTQE